ncbi:MAG: radical SAM protein [Candidatus Aminicenantes bacterium]|nr:radical SAM protein [Candidatus Aminicenantes bacterium]
MAKETDYNEIIRQEEMEKGVESVTHTYLGSPINPLSRGLPKTISSLCPECCKVIEGRLFEENGKVMLEKECPVHGRFRDIYWSDVNLYLKAERWTFGEGHGLTNPKVTKATKCPQQCGMCNLHTSHTALGNVDLTNRCDLTCPVCFANSNVAGYLYEPSFEQVLTMLKTLRDMKPVKARAVQFSGGEPTLHPRFLDTLRAARDMGFSHIQVASNGLNLSDPEFAMKCAEAGLHNVYLQLDGVSDDVYLKTRGRPLHEIKLKAIDSLRKAHIKVVFVPTIIKGVNNHEVGDILRLALENIDTVSGISYQPVAFTGRISEKKRMEQRYTLPDLAKDLKEQTGLFTDDDWYPLCSTVPFTRFLMALRGFNSVNVTCHPHCSLATYLFVNQDDPLNTAKPITQFVDIPNILKDFNKLAGKAGNSRIKAFSKIRAFQTFRKHFKEEKAPKGLTFLKFLDQLAGLMDKDIGREPEGHQRMALMVGGMHFMDIYNYDVERVKRCVIHYTSPDGSLYPFCTYNSGPYFREKVEKKFSTPLPGK